MDICAFGPASECGGSSLLSPLSLGTSSGLCVGQLSMIPPSELRGVQIICVAHRKWRCIVDILTVRVEGITIGIGVDILGLFDSF